MISSSCSIRRIVITVPSTEPYLTLTW